MEKRERVAVPIVTVFRSHAWALVLGTLIAVATFLLFYLLTVFCQQRRQCLSQRPRLSGMELGLVGIRP